MKAILEFSLPDDEPEHRYALAGRDALIALEQIDEWARGKIKHGEIGEEAEELLRELRAMVPHELVQLLR
jgi:hypothetical protein